MTAPDGRCSGADQRCRRARRGPGRRRSRQSAALVAQRLRRAAAVRRRGSPAGGGQPGAADRPAHATRSACARSSCARNRTSGAARSSSSSTACPIFAKGSNWIPADSFPTRISDAYLEGLIRSAAESHQNMLRVWGGGFYEEERFYDLCDRYGILVWQDFIFACSIYPLDDAGLRRERARRSGRERAPAAPSRQPGAVVRQQRDGVGLGGAGAGTSPRLPGL